MSDRAGSGDARSGGKADRGARAAAAFGLTLLGYLAVIAAFGRDAARLHLELGGIPLFLGEATLVLLAAALGLGWVVRGRLPLDAGALDWAVVGFLLVGSAFALRGVLAGHGLAVFRDFAIVYYAAFFLLVRVFLASGGSGISVLAAVAAGATVGAWWSVALFLLDPVLSWEHGVPGYTALVAWVAMLLALLLHAALHTRATGVLAAASLPACTFMTYLSGYRTMAAVVLASLTVLALAAALRWRTARRTFALGLLCAGVTAAGVALHVSLAPDPNRLILVDGSVPLADGLLVISNRWAGLVAPGSSAVRARMVKVERHSGGVRPADLVRGLEVSYSFRARAWKAAVERIRGAPWLGIGFGPDPKLHPESHCDLVASPSSNCGNAHNTYLTVAMRMGIPVLVLFLALNAAIVVRAARTACQPRARASPVRQVLLLGPLVALASFAVYASTSLFLESPYLSSVYWSLLGLLHHVSGEDAA